MTAPERCLACGEAPRTLFPRHDTGLVRCPRCGLEWRRPFPTSEELESLYGAGYFERWGLGAPGARERVRAVKQASYRAFLAAIRRHRPQGRLLDVGCAFGFLLGAAREAGYVAYGLDRNTEAIAAARREHGDRVHAGELDARAFPGLRFDVITLIDVLEHVPDPAELLGALRGRLAPGGVVAAVLPNAASGMRRLLGRRWPHYAPEHLFLWTPDALRRFLRAQGWRVLALETGLRKTYTAEYLRAYARAVGSWLPPGLGLLGPLRLRVPTGEMLAVATPDDAAPPPHGRGAREAALSAPQPRRGDAP